MNQQILQKDESKNTIREMLSEERPYEKCERFGAGSLTDIELLAVLLRTGTKGESALNLARKLFYPGEGTQPQAKAHLQSWTKEELLKMERTILWILQRIFLIYMRKNAKSKILIII